MIRLKDIHPEWKRWLWSIACLLPIFLFYFAHFYIPTKLGFYSTGFIQYDQLSYMAFGRQHFDEGFHLFYNNPFSVDADAPHIYFQPHIFLLGILHQFLPFAPGTTYLLFGFVSAVVCVRIYIALYEKIIGFGSFAQNLGFLLFIWGGGLLAICGFFQNIFIGQTFAEAWGKIFEHEPALGWWFLNLGRNLIFPTEAYYHLLFFGTILLILRNKIWWSAATTTLLSMSQPFSGLQLICILFAWGIMERLVVKRRIVSSYYVTFLACLLAAHLFYYLFFLNQFEEHRAIYRQWTLDWLLEAKAFIPAYILVGSLAFYSVRNIKLAQTFFQKTHNRLFFIWFLVSFALAKHELFVAPHQPIHFARGYIWSSLFLLGAESLVALLNYFHKHTSWQKFLWIPFSVLFLSDNLLWISLNSFRAMVLSSASSYEVHGFFWMPTEKQLIDWLAQRSSNGEILICEDDRITYYTTAYTPYRSWKAHTYTSPNVDQRTRELVAFFQDGTLAPEMGGKSFLIIFHTRRPQPFEESLKNFGHTRRVFENAQFTAFEVETIHD
ncbi:MAG: hypothetical protein ACOY3I_03970 [Verrucomicrobiota bacterium]